MMSNTAVSGSPRSNSLTAGSRRPSWKISVASVDIDPAVMPPTSFQCAMFITHATSSSPANTGMASTASLRCVTAPCQGSLVMKTSPGAISPGPANFWSTN